MLKITIPVSVGELLDKISILKIKSNHTENSYVLHELQDLIKIAQEHHVYSQKYLDELFEINSKLWKVEDELRIFEKSNKFDEKFIDLSRLVYTYNDKRAEIKKIINQEYDSEYCEVKIYK